MELVEEGNSERHEGRSEDTGPYKRDDCFFTPMRADHRGDITKC